MADLSLLNIFESKVRSNIITFCKDLSNTHADLYVIMARKAACLISALEKLNLISLHGEVISERVMDSNIEWHRYKQVIIIDDVIISGTTLHKTIEIIHNGNPEIDVKLYVLGVNEKWYNEDVLKHDGKSYIEPPIRIMSNSECIRLSGDIVRMLAKFPMPYNIDFPIYNTLKLNDGDYRQVLTMTGWEVSEVTPFVSSDSKVFAHTFLPTVDTLRFCGSFYLSDFIRHSLLKIRTYGRSRTDKQHRYHFLTIVPMIIMPPIDIATMEAFYKELAGDKVDELSKVLLTPTAKLRFIQFVLADVLARNFILRINNLLGSENIIYREFNSLRYLFPNRIIESINERADRFNGYVSTRLEHLIPDQQVSEKGRTIDNLLDVNKQLISPFVSMYYDEEIPSRKLVKQLGKSVFDGSQYKTILGRLSRGISLDSLYKLLGDIPHIQKFSFVSAFLDRAIDEGIVVPITVSDGNKVYRAFRHGEDVQFGQQEERLCYDMLSSFAKSSKRHQLPKLWVEKMLVLLFQIGEGDVFVPIQTNLCSYSHISCVDKVDAASVRYYLQGPLIVKTPSSSIIGKPYLEYNDKALWLSSYFTDSNRTPLKVDSASGMYIFDEAIYKDISSGSNQIVVDSKKSQFAKRIGLLFGHLLSNGQQSDKPFLTGDELVMLTSSLETKCVIGAMAAEINICSNAYIAQNTTSVYTFLVNIYEQRVSASIGLERLRKSAWHQALNDGIRKFRWYIDKAGYEIIERINTLLEDDLYRETWNSFWSPNLENYGNEEKAETVELATVEGLWLMCTNAYFLMFSYLVMKREDSGFTSSSIMDRINETYSVIKRFEPHPRVREILPLMIEFQTQHHKQDYDNRTIPIIFERLTAIFNRTFKILEDSRTFFANSLSMPDYQYYHHSLYIETENEEGSQILKNLYESILYRMHKSEETPKTEIIFIPQSGSIFASPNHLLLISYNENGHKWLIQFAVEAIKKIKGVCRTKIFLFPLLPSDCHVKVSVNGQLYYQLFSNFMMGMIDSIQTVPFGSDSFYVFADSTNKETSIVISRDYDSYKPTYADDRMIYIPNKREYKLVKYQDMSIVDEQIMPTDIGIITIVDEEARAVCNGFGMDMAQSKHINNRYYDESVYHTNVKDFRIVHTQCANQGNVSMAVTVMEFERLFHPRWMVLLGIAGSIRDKINLCDVVIGTPVYYYESRRENADGTVDRRLRNYNMSFEMENHITRYRSLIHQPILAAAGSPQTTFNLHVTPIGTGEAVVGNNLSDIKKWLLSVNSKTGAVETEAAGFSAAFNESTNSLNDILIIRGISDKADEDKSDKWRQPASDNAVTVLKDFISKMLSRL